MTLTGWQCGAHQLPTHRRTLVMGILNVTPDSFSDGGRFDLLQSAVSHAADMVSAGADILDIGGESTRPGAEPVDADEECRRVIPVLEKLSGQAVCPLSIDTRKGIVARRALEAGASIVNDVTAGQDDQLLEAVAEHRAGLVLMHMQGRPGTMQDAPSYEDPVGEITAYLQARMAAAEAAGVHRDRLAVDPGIGFGKTLEHNLQLLRGLDRIRAACGVPVLIGLSRKRWLGELTGRPVDQRLSGSLAGLTYALLHGADIVRVHDVMESCDAVRVVDTLTAKDIYHGDPAESDTSS